MGRAWDAIAAWARGYTRAQRRVAFQVLVAVGITVAIVASEPVWEALTYPDHHGGASPMLAVVLLFLLFAPNQGASTLNAAFMAVAMIIGGALAIAVSFAAWAAGGGDWMDNGWAKGATFTCLGAVALGAINAVRWRWELTSQLFLMAAAVFVFASGVTYYYIEFAWEAAFYSMASAAIAAAVTALVSWFVFPVTAAEQYRANVAGTLRALGAAVGGLESLALAPIDPSTGRLAAATGKIDWATGDDQGLAPAVAPVRAALTKARNALLASRALHVPVKMEVDVYGGRPWKRFPSENFMHLKICIRLAVATAGTLARPLRGGRFDMRLFQHLTLRSALTDVFNGIAATTEAVAAAVEGEATWAAADEALATMDAAWLAYLDAALATTRHSSAAAAADGAAAAATPPLINADAVFAVRSLSAFIYMLGSRVRAIYAAAAGAVACKDPSAVPLALARMEATPGWPKSADAFRNPEGGATAALEALQRAAASIDVSVREGHLGHARRLSSTFPAFSAVIRAGTARGRAAAAHRVRRALAIPSWLLYGLQYAVAMAVALVMMAIPAVAKTALRGRTLDLVATVAMTWMPSVGDATRRALNRTAGTALAAVWSYALIGLAYLASGLTWNDTVPKWIILAVGMAVWGAFCMLNSFRYFANFGYAWLVAGLTVPLVAMPALRMPEVPWVDVGWRLINVSMGVVIVWIVALVAFPLSAHRIAAAAMDSALDDLAELVRQLPLHLEGVEGNGGGANGQQHQAAPGTAALRLSFFSEVHVLPVGLSFRITRALGDLYATILALEAERLPWGRTPKAPRGAAATAALSIQVLLNVIDITFAHKMENGPGGVWRIPAAQLALLTKVTALIAAALEDLREAMNGTDDALEAALKHVEAVDRALAAQTKEALEEVAAAEAEGTPAGRQLQTEVAVLVYLGYYASQQLKTAAAAVTRAFCLGPVARSAAAAAAAAGLMSLAEASPPEGALGPEHAIARLLESSARPEREESVELAVLREVSGQTERPMEEEVPDVEDASMNV